MCQCAGSSRISAGSFGVAWVKYAGLKNSPYKNLRKPICQKGPGSLLAFGIHGGQEAGVKFIEGVQFLSHLANVGDAKKAGDSSRIHHPSSVDRRGADYSRREPPHDSTVGWPGDA
ncbi:MAG: hypothetical protein CM1200mP18_07560 [Gammaproteobacteria bacterium]|nr:MAG: hypothetical protein CM1200mP18_07560 [Gammaproteobacteria bacterium]